MKNLPIELINKIFDYFNIYMKKYSSVIKEINKKPTFESFLNNKIYVFSCIILIKSLKLKNYEFLTSMYYKKAYSKACELNS
jgi:hypothetical protein